MPRFNGINTDRLELFARKLLGIRQGGIMPSLSPEPALSINLPLTFDQYGLAGAMPCGAVGSIAAVAAQFSVVALTNASSNLLVVGRFAGANSAGVASQISTAASASNLLGLANIAPNNAGWADTRRALTSFPMAASALTFGQGNVAALPAGFWVFGRTYAVDMADGPTFVVSPGMTVAAWHQTVNLPLTWEFRGFVVAALPDELSEL